MGAHTEDGRGRGAGGSPVSLWRWLRQAVTSVTGDPDRRRAHREIVRGLSPTGRSVSELAPSARLEEGSSPVFCFAPTWRCGSTLLQRLVMSTGSIWMWGEVYTRAGILRRMVDTFLPFGDAFPDPDMFRSPDREGNELTDDWIARLSPEPRHLIEAHRAFWDRLCARPAKERGYERWGLKEVHLPVDHAIYLRRLYPDARLVFLVRNPYRAWLSYRRYGNWYARFPDEPVFTVQRFARMWADHTAGFLRFARETDSLLLRFEDLVGGGESLSELSEHLGSRVDASVLDRRVSGTDSRPGRSTTVVERLVLRRYTAGPADELGYEPV